jgi:oligopeptidase A
MSNPLLEDQLLPSFSTIKPEHIFPATKAIIDENLAQIAKLLDHVKLPTWANFIEPMNKLDNRLQNSWSPVGHMNAVVNSPEGREEYEKCLPLLSEYSTQLGQNKKLYDAYISLSKSPEYQNYSVAKKKVISNALRDFALSGIALPEDKQKQFGEISKELSQLANSFSNNVLDATMAWSKHITDEQLIAGLPEGPKTAAKEAAEAKDLKGWLFSLNFPSFSPLMTYCENRELRQEAYTAFVTRASAQGPDAGKFDNTENIEKIMALRIKKAKLLGFNNFAELSIETKMADSTDVVLSFLNNLASKSIDQSRGEMKETHEFAKTLGIEDLQVWDTPFVGEKLREHKYAFSKEEVREYFAADRVISGMFEIVNRLYGIDIKQQTEFDAWHEDVRFYKIFRDGKHIASFYLDPFARENKRGGAWMDSCRSRYFTSKIQQLPVAYLVCNFTGPVGDKPSLLTHDEVVTLFHEFGHGLHHTLTKVDEIDVSGINGVAWDAVELPSQFMENWCWEKDGLEIIAEHYKTGKKLPQELLDKMLAAKNYNAANTMLRQLQFALFDFTIHCNYAEDDFIGVQETLNKIRTITTVIDTPEFNQFQCGFSHIFAGGYSAGYYSYKWAEVLSADAYSKLEEQGIFNRQTGLEFLENVLEKGGSEDASDLFKAFRGREPKIDALLRHSGIC